MKKLVLLVHDDLESPLARKHLLELAGYRVRAMQRVDDCLRAIHEATRPALVMTDVLVHGATGFELCTRVREEFTPAELPVLITTSLFRDAVYREEATRVGAGSYLVRPIDPRELLREVHRLTTGD